MTEPTSELPIEPIDKTTELIMEMYSQETPQTAQAMKSRGLGFLIRGPKLARQIGQCPKL